MPNTKKLSHDDRKKAKRGARKKFKAKIKALTYKERKQLRKFEGPTVKFLRQLATAKAAAEAQ